MNATLARKLRFSDVVYAINTTPKSLRLWLQRGLVDIHTAKAEGGWTEYSFHDIAILALVRQLVNFGIDVAKASDLANTAMTAFFPQLLNVPHPDEMPAGALAMMWTGSRLYVFPIDDGNSWDLRCVQLWASGLIENLTPNFNPGLPSGVAMIRSEHEPAPMFLSIDVATILRAAFERAEESVNGGVDEANDE